jgi:hypothetical protein
VWAFRLEPEGQTTTVVIEIYDCTRSPEWSKQAVRGGTRWMQSMKTTWPGSTNNAHRSFVTATKAQGTLDQPAA